MENGKFFENSLKYVTKFFFYMKKVMGFPLWEFYNECCAFHIVYKLKK